MHSDQHKTKVHKTTQVLTGLTALPDQDVFEKQCPVQKLQPKATEAIGVSSIFVEYSNEQTSETTPAVVGFITPESIRRIRAELQLPHPISPLADTPPERLGKTSQDMEMLQPPASAAIGVNSICCEHSSEQTPEKTPNVTGFITPASIRRIRTELQLLHPISPLADTPPERYGNTSNTTQIMETLEIFSISIRIDEGTQLSEDQRRKLNQVFKKYEVVFAEIGSPARFTEHRINTGNHLPVASTPYRLSPAKRTILKEEPTKMIKEDIVEESESPYAAPVVLIPKKNGGTRVCIDYSQLNSITVPD